MKTDLAPASVAERLDALRRLYVPETASEGRRRAAQTRPAEKPPLAEAAAERLAELRALCELTSSLQRRTRVLASARDLAEAISEGMNAIALLRGRSLVDPSAAADAFDDLERALVRYDELGLGSNPGAMRFTRDELEDVRRMQRLVIAWRASGEAPPELASLADAWFARMLGRLQR